MLTKLRSNYNKLMSRILKKKDTGDLFKDRFNLIKEALTDNIPDKFCYKKLA